MFLDWYAPLRDRLASQLGQRLRTIDLWNGQTDYLEAEPREDEMPQAVRQEVLLPAVFVQFPRIDMQQQMDGTNRGEGRVVLHVAQAYPLQLSRYPAGEAHRTKWQAAAAAARQTDTLVEANALVRDVHAAMQGFAAAGIGPLIGLDVEHDTNFLSVLLIRLHYVAAVGTDAASQHRNRHPYRPQIREEVQLDP